MSESMSLSQSFPIELLWISHTNELSLFTHVICHPYIHLLCVLCVCFCAMCSLRFALHANECQMPATTWVINKSSCWYTDWQTRMPTEGWIHSKLFVCGNQLQTRALISPKKIKISKSATSYQSANQKANQWIQMQISKPEVPISNRIQISKSATSYQSANQKANQWIQSECRSANQKAKPQPDSNQQLVANRPIQIQMQISQSKCRSANQKACNYQAIEPSKQSGSRCRIQEKLWEAVFTDLWFLQFLQYLRRKFAVYLRYIWGVCEPCSGSGLKKAHTLVASRHNSMLLPESLFYNQLWIIL